MKGKGKGERREKDKDKDKDKDREETKLDKDCPLNLPALKPVDHARQCPRYSSILERDDDEGVGVEELDILQAELETLLASVAKRMRLLESEINILNNWQDIKSKDKKGTPGKVQPEVVPSPSHSGKRSGGKGGEEKSNKRFKDSAGKAAATPTSVKPKGKGQPKISEPEPPESPKPAVIAPVSSKVAVLPTENPHARVIKNDAPNRFWSMVEPYCREVASEDLKVLEDIMRTHEDEVEYYKVPSLGKHYAQKWAQEDLLDEQREGAKLTKKGQVNNNNIKKKKVPTATLR